MATSMTAKASSRRRIVVRSFLGPVLVLGLLAVLTFPLGSVNGRHSPLRAHGLSRRDASIAPEAFTAEVKHKDLECRLVHEYEDKCAFIKANCPDEEAGLLSYLQFYYCKLDHAKPIAFTILVLWLGILFSTIGIAASDFFCINLSTISNLLGMSESLAGVTFLAFGNGSPDVFSTYAAMKSHSGSLAIGELIGAAGFITAVVAGSMALVRPFKVPRKTFVRDVGFFAVAASFSMVFLADGHLNMWECVVMIAFYIFYVGFVFVWHWYFRRRAQRRMIDNTVRSHFHVTGPDDEHIEPYRDEEDDEGPGSSRAPLRTIPAEDFAALERGNGPQINPIDGAEIDEETRELYLAQLSSNMRLNRPKPGERRNTINPIRPSLVGALEFNAVLSSIRKSRNIQTIPINLRRYSDDPSFTLAQQQERREGPPEPTDDDPDAHQVAAERLHRSRSQIEQPGGATRVRAVSVNDAANVQVDPAILQRPIGPDIDLIEPSPLEIPHLDTSPNGLKPEAAQRGSADFLSTTARSDYGYLAHSPGALTPIDRRSTSSSPVPDEVQFRSFLPPSRQNTGSSRNSLYPPSDTHIPQHAISRSQRNIGSTPVSPFPEYHDDPNYKRSSRAPSIRLPPPSIASESTAHLRTFEEDESEEKPIAWWPNKILPSPRTLFSTLFPTLYKWSTKSNWERLLSVVAAPSVFLLTITLPVVETNEEDEAKPNPDPGLLSPKDGPHSHNDARINILPPDSPSTDLLGESNSQTTITPSPPKSAHVREASSPTSSPKEWNRWLVATQFVLAPLFVTLLCHANGLISLVRPVLISLLISLTLLGILLLTSEPSRPPRYRPVLTFLGFIVSMTWISNIANEVVGVLKALGVILRISDAILGLTVFAVGNSLGDLVADITVAKLGYPVMALSACFGGPMLNILIGIGASGLIMTLRGGNKYSERHPGRPVKYKPYVISINPSLVISGITLLVTLLGLLIVVPMNKWIMGRRVGWGLIALWVASTVSNVVVEIGGWARDIS